MRIKTFILAFAAVMAVSLSAIAHGPPPPGFSGCSFGSSGNNAAGTYYETWSCDQGSVTCWDTDGDGSVNYSDPKTGQGICAVGGANS